MSVFLIDDYQILETVVDTKNTSLYKVENKNSKEIFALKQIKTNQFEQHKQQLNQLLILQQIQHKNIMPCLGFSLNVDKKGKPNTLENEILQRAEKSEFFTVHELGRLTTILIKLFAFLQENSISHRDIKPQNILINEKNKILLSDFTNSIRLSQFSLCEDCVGTPHYFSPELKKKFAQGPWQPKSQYNPFKSDVYSLGIMILDLVTLTIEDDIPNEKKLQISTNLYGKRFTNLIELMLIEDIIFRPAFTDLLNCDEYFSIKEFVQLNQSPISHNSNYDFQDLILQKTTSIYDEDKLQPLFDKLIEVYTLTSMNYEEAMLQLQNILVQINKLELKKAKNEQ